MKMQVYSRGTAERQVFSFSAQEATVEHLLEVPDGSELLVDGGKLQLKLPSGRVIEAKQAYVYASCGVSGFDVRRSESQPG